MTTSNSITGVVLTFNEETDLGRALSSLSWCDDLLVLDSGSTDQTRHVVLQHGARFLTHIQSGPFLVTRQRNWALEHGEIKTQWTLFLDADEEIGPTLRKDIQHTLLNAIDIDAYELTPRFWFLGKWLKHTQNYPNWHPRLVRTGHIRFEGGVWETFSTLSRVGRINEPYEHYAFSKGLDDWIERHRRYATWEAERTHKYNKTHNLHSFATQRKLYLRAAASYLGLLRVPLRFIQKYFCHLGFLEGREGLLFSLLMATYELYISIKIVELNRREMNLPL